ncbi:MAG TPA: response regulator, partial [Anaerolineae bacterium]|nr:response regulator [Anaerolineae bacterium]
MSSTGHILIIDDEAALRQSLARILQMADFEVTTADSADQGLAFIQTTSFDLIFMDLRMPGMAGLDALKLIHANYPNLPVVLFTAQPDINSAVEALRNGATDYLLKPLKPQVIIERAQKVIANQRKEIRKQEIAQQIEALQAELKSLNDGEPNPLPLISVDAERYLKRGELVLDLYKRCLLIDEQPINIPHTTFNYLLV